MSFLRLVSLALLLNALAGCEPEKRDRWRPRADGGGVSEDGGDRDGGDDDGGGDGGGSDGGDEDGGDEDGGGSDGGEDGGDGGDGGGGDEDGGPGDGGDGGSLNTRPRAESAVPSGNGGAISLAFVLHDEESDSLSVSIGWSLDGASWSTATPQGQPQLSGLASSPAGVLHGFVWNSPADLPDQLQTVVLRVVPSDGRGAGTAALSEPFIVNNRLQNTLPEAAWEEFPTAVRGDVRLSFVAIDEDADLVRASVRYRIGSSSLWSPITLAAASPPLEGIAASPEGTPVPFVWASGTDLANANVDQVQLRVVLEDRVGPGQVAEGPRFSVRNGPLPKSLRIEEVGTGSHRWVELYNSSSSSVNLENWTLGFSVEPGYRGTRALPATTIPAGGRVLVRDDAGTSTSTVLYLANQLPWRAGEAGSASLLNPEGIGIDFVRWELSPEPPPNGTFWNETTPLFLPHNMGSLSRTGGDTDASTDFCFAQATPGAAQGTCFTAAPASAVLRLNEIFAGGGTETEPDWVELRNAGAASLDVRNWSITTVSMNRETGSRETNAALLRTVTLTAGARLVVRSGTGSDSAGVQYTGSANLNLYAARPGAVTLRDPSGRPVDHVRFGGIYGAEPPGLPAAGPAFGSLFPPGWVVSLSRSPESSEVAASAWCPTRRSSGTANRECEPSGVGRGLRINEVGMGKFGSYVFNSDYGMIELLFTGTGALWLGDWAVRWSNGGEYRFGDTGVDETTRRPPYISECALNTPSGAVCGGSMPWGFWGSATSGYVELLDSAGRSLDFVRFGGDKTQPSAGGAWTETVAVPALTAASNGSSRSIARGEPPLLYTDTNDASDWCLQSRTPGAANHTCP